MRRTLLSLVSLLALGCAPNVGPDGLLIGGPCRDTLDCVTGAYCLEDSREFPEGTCTTVCDDDDDCRGDSSCIEIRSGACLLRCDEDADCGREGYTCQRETRRGSAGDVMVCAGGG
ncbi:MAG TPA: hypothetical protein RMH99_11910 [Sandaracinaceae bacterium LLY-WYZ-13_1]|nr:hypothetical protein [Sandaracinaceae bacterium LLY-WYZ-13_1]